MKNYAQAFPFVYEFDANGSKAASINPGLTKREYAAIAAVNGLLSLRSHPNIDLDRIDFNKIVKQAVEITDLLLDALEENNE